MKKVYTTIFLFISLFFFYSSGVKADTLSYSVDSLSKNYINDDLILVRNHAINYINESDYNYYLIYYTNNRFNIYYFNEYIGNFIIQDSVLKLNTSLSFNYTHYYQNSNFYSNSMSKNTSLNMTIFNTTIRYLLIDTNYDNFIYSGDSELNIIYDSCTYNIENGDKVKGLYEYYVANQNSCTLESEDGPDIHSEEKEILSNFYTLVIEKINVFTTSIFSNYIYLSVIGIFILIFTIGLVRRLL